MYIETIGDQTIDSDYSRNYVNVDTNTQFKLSPKMTENNKNRSKLLFRSINIAYTL